MVLTIQNKQTTRKLDNCISLHNMGISGGRGGVNAILSQCPSNINFRIKILDQNNSTCIMKQVI